MEGKDVYILLAFALFCRRRPVLPHRRSPCRFTGDHPVHHVDDALSGLTPSTANFPTDKTKKSSPTNLTLRDRSDPCDTQVHHNVHDADDPEHPRVVSPVVAEDDSEDDATEVACG